MIASRRRVNRNRRSSLLRPLVLVAVLAIGATAVAAAASTPPESSDGSSALKADRVAADGVAQAKRLVAQYMRPVKWQSPGPAFDATKARGKTLWFVPISLAIPFETILVQGIKQGFSTVGAKINPCDPKGSAADEARCFDQAVSQHASVVADSGIDHARLRPQLQSAAKAGVKVIAGHDQEPGPLDRSEPSPPVVASASHSSKIPGRMMGDFVVADSNGKANVIFFGASDAKTSPIIQNAFTGELKKYCPNCKWKSIDVPVAQWSSLSSRIGSILKANSQATYLVPVFDGMVLYMVPGIHAAGAQDRVKIVSYNASPAVMDLLAKHDVVAAEAGSPILWEGWGFADQALRIMAGQKPLLDIKTPNRLFTYANIKSINMKAQESTWYGKVPFQSHYKKLWGAK
jgi:ribose transport system substrate-binding protein